MALSIFDPGEVSRYVRTCMYIRYCQSIIIPTLSMISFPGLLPYALEGWISRNDEMKR